VDQVHASKFYRIRQNDLNGGTYNRSRHDIYHWKAFGFSFQAL